MMVKYLPFLFFVTMACTETQQQASLHMIIHENELVDQPSADSKQTGSTLALAKSRQCMAQFNEARFDANNIPKAKLWAEKAIVELESKERNVEELDFLLDIYTVYSTFLSENHQLDSARLIALKGYGLSDFSQSNWRFQVGLLYRIGDLYGREGNDISAISYYEQAIQLYKVKRGIADGILALLHNNTALSHSNAYLQFNAIEHYHQAVQIWEDLVLDEKEIQSLITAYQNLIFELVAYGDLVEARKVCDRLNTTFYGKYIIDGKYTSQVPNFRESRYMHLLGNVRIEAAEGNFEASYAYIDTLKAEWLDSWLETDRSSVDIILGAYQTLFDYTYNRENYALTERYALEALNLAEQYNYPFFRLVCNAKLASSYEKQRQFPHALPYILQAEKSMAFTSFSASKYAIQIIKAMVYSGLGQQDTAAAIVRETITEIIAHRTNRQMGLLEASIADLDNLSSYTFIRIFSVGAKIYFDHYIDTHDSESLAIAKNLYRLAAGIFNNYYLQGVYNDQIDRLHLDIVEGLLEVLLEEGHDIVDQLDLLNLIERNASQHLIKEFDRKLQLRRPEHTALKAERVKLEVARDHYVQQLEGIGSHADGRKLDSILVDIQARLNEVDKELWFTDTCERRFDVSAFDLQKVMAILPEEQQLVKFYVTANYVYRVLIANTDLQLKKIGSTATLRQTVLGYVNVVNTINPNYVTLSEELFREMSEGVDAKSVCIIPSNFLNYLSYESLKSENTGRYWVEDVAISYAYSLPMWYLQQTIKYKNKSRMKLAAFAPVYDGESLTHDRQQLYDLKYARSEASTIASIFGGDSYLHEQASKAHFMKQREKYDIFHFAMHSFLYEDDFPNSCLVFSNEEKLYFSELYDLHIPAHMVVLSACNTGNGKLVKGEGVMSLSRAFLYAGVPSTVVSLWQVPDKETSEVMQLFYRNLKKGWSKDQALADARRTFIKNNPMKVHPYYWAGFIVNGDVRPMMRVGNFLWITTGISVLLVVALVILYKRKRKSPHVVQ